MIKVLFELKPADWHSAATETLWATPLGNKLYRLENSPFYAQGYSYQDVVFAEQSDNDALPIVRTTVTASGHSTYALWVINNVESNGAFAKHWQSLETLGCSFEGVHGQLLSVDVPPSTDIDAVYKLMLEGESEGIWHVQEQHFSRPD